MRMLQAMAAALMILAGVAGAARAEEDVLTITNGKQTIQLDRAALGKLRQDAIETKTPWTAGSTTFSGPAFTDVMNEAGFAGETVTAASVDGKTINIPRGRLTADGAILALSMNGKPLPADRAPFWIVFPYDRSPALADTQHHTWSPWGVTKLIVK